MKFFIHVYNATELKAFQQQKKPATGKGRQPKYILKQRITGIHSLLRQFDIISIMRHLRRKALFY